MVTLTHVITCCTFERAGSTHVNPYLLPRTGCGGYVEHKQAGLAPWQVYEQGKGQD